MGLRDRALAWLHPRLEAALGWVEDEMERGHRKVVAVRDHLEDDRLVDARSRVLVDPVTSEALEMVASPRVADSGSRDGPLAGSAEWRVQQAQRDARASSR